MRARLTRPRALAAGAAVVVLLGGVLALANERGSDDGSRGQTQDQLAPGESVGPDAEPTSGPTAGEGGQPLRSYAGLCRAFQAEALTNGDVASDPSYAALADDAGGTGEIKKYCQELLGTRTPGPGGSSTSTDAPSPTRTAGPDDPAVPTASSGPTRSGSPTPTVGPTPTTGTPSPTPTRTRQGGKPTKTPRS